MPTHEPNTKEDLVENCLEDLDKYYASEYFVGFKGGVHSKAILRAFAMRVVEASVPEERPATITKDTKWDFIDRGFESCRTQTLENASRILGVKE